MPSTPSPFRLASAADRVLAIHNLDLAQQQVSDVANTNLLHTYAAAGISKTTPSPSLCGLSWCADGSCLASASVGSPKLVLTYCKGGAFTSTEITVALAGGASTSSSRALTSVSFPRTTIKRLLLATEASSQSVVALYDVAKRKAVKEFQCKFSVTCLACNTNDSLTAAGCVGGAVSLFNMVNNNVSVPLYISQAEANTCDITCVRFSRSRRHLLASSSDAGSVALWDCNANSVLKAFKEHAAPCTGVAFSPVNDQLVVSCGLDKRCVCYDVEAQKKISEFKTESPLTAAEALPDGRSVALGTSTGKVLVYDLRNFSRPAAVFDGPMAGTAVRAVVCQPPPETPTVGNGSAAASLLMRRSKSKPKLMPRAQSSTVNLMKENVPSAPPPPISPVTNHATRPHSSEFVSSPSSVALAPPAAANRDSFSSQIFSPLKEGGGGGFASSSQSSIPSPGGLSGNFNVSRDQLFSASSAGGNDGSVVFSPLREHSFNSPLGGDRTSGGGPLGRGSGGSFLKTPIESFNRSITSPLVSPLTMIREEDVLGAANNVKGGDEHDLSSPGRPRKPPQLSREDFRKSSCLGGAGDSSPVSSKTIKATPFVEEASTVQAALGEEQRTLATTASTLFKESNVVASTPFSKNDGGLAATAFPALNEIQEEESKREDEETTVVDGGKDRQAAVGELKNVLTAFPKAFLEANAAGSVDARSDVPPTKGSNHEEHTDVAATPSSLQRDFIEQSVSDAMNEHCRDMRMFLYRMEFYHNLAFYQHREEFASMLRDYAVNERLVEENRRLKEENDELRKYY